jgi:hypothetical protein
MLPMSIHNPTEWRFVWIRLPNWDAESGEPFWTAVAVCADLQSAWREQFNSHRPFCLSLTPGFSPVETGGNDDSRFNGFWHTVKAAEAAPSSLCLKSPG